MLTFDQRLGLFFTIEGSLLSVISVSIILGLAIYKWLQRTVFSWGKWRIRGPDASDSSLFLNLMLADLVQAIGNMPSLKWMSDGEITEGHLCTAQAALKQVGIVGVAWTSLAIAFHTFSVLVLRWNPPKYASKVMVIGVWVLTGLIVGIPNAVHKNQQYYGESGYWCWIKQDFKTEKIVTEYLWVWLAAGVMAILYTIMYAVMRGWLIVDNGIHWYKNYNPSLTGKKEVETEEEKDMKAIARMLLFYPMVYIFCILPNTIARWISFSSNATPLDALSGNNNAFPPYQLTFFASTIFALSGMFNVILFFATRPELIVSPNFTIEAEDLSLHRGNSSGVSSNKFGRLPDRQSTVFPHDPEKPSHPRTLSESNHLQTSPRTMNASLSSHENSVGNPAYLSPERSTGAHQRSRGSSFVIEEEDYGSLPT